MPPKKAIPEGDTKEADVLKYLTERIEQAATEETATLVEELNVWIANRQLTPSELGDILYLIKEGHPVINAPRSMFLRARKRIIDNLTEREKA